MKEPKDSKSFRKLDENGPSTTDTYAGEKQIEINKREERMIEEKGEDTVSKLGENNIVKSSVRTYVELNSVELATWIKMTYVESQ